MESYAITSTPPNASVFFINVARRSTPPVSAAFSMTMLLNTHAGDAYTFAEFEVMLRAAGFITNEIQQVPASPGA